MVFGTIRTCIVQFKADSKSGRQRLAIRRRGRRETEKKKGQSEREREVSRGRSNRQTRKI